ncbi:unnamed protein product [Citrullus colocynthis]|uniref:Uncharacterized protein n=1 Tax=Citrullus colocynthis TaxID=252529 RepID=A0ABP0XNZ1_9ROSI
MNIGNESWVVSLWRLIGLSLRVKLRHLFPPHYEEGQDTHDELQRRNLRDELEDREKESFFIKEQVIRLLKNYQCMQYLKTVLPSFRRMLLDFENTDAKTFLLLLSDH